MLPPPDQATTLIARHLPNLPTEDCALEHAAGRILRQALIADRPLPPFDRVTMDGYAIRAADLAAEPTRPLRITGYQAAGMIAKTLGDAGTTIEIATGAVLPGGADTIIPYEDTTKTDHDDRHIHLTHGAPCQLGQNIHPAGSDVIAGTELVPAGTRLTGREIALAATVGAARLSVAARSSVAIIATGDELVPVDAPTIAPHQIRRSNDQALHAALSQSQLAGRIERFHLRDDRTDITRHLSSILAEFDLTLLTGGVSKGQRDYVPDVLAELGVTNHLHGVAQRPGKPLWFGTTARQTPVFALPGNPVSTYTCLHRYVLPALRQMAGLPPAAPETVVLTADVDFAKPLSYLVPVRVATSPAGVLEAHPLPFNTSGDLGGLLHTDGFVELPAGPAHFAKGFTAPLWRWT